MFFPFFILFFFLTNLIQNHLISSHINEQVGEGGDPNFVGSREFTQPRLLSQFCLKFKVIDFFAFNLEWSKSLKCFGGYFQLEVMSNVQPKGFGHSFALRPDCIGRIDFSPRRKTFNVTQKELVSPSRPHVCHGISKENKNQAIFAVWMASDCNATSQMEIVQILK